MERPTRIHIEKLENKYSITCVDELTGSGNGIDLPINGYLALKEHFKTGAMDISSDEVNEALNLASVVQQRELLTAFMEYLEIIPEFPENDVLIENFIVKGGL
jgi:GTP-dependent phosphoenolpyruvate carboxykinase